MEPLPTQGQTLRHYTASRPRPRRTRTQPPSSRPQETVSEVDYDTNEAMGRVDEGVEEFFTKKILPDYALKGRWAQATPTESSPTPSTSTPFFSPSDIIPSPISTNITPPSVASPDTSLSSTNVPLIDSPSPAPSVDPTSTTNALPSKNIKKRFGDFFAFKRTRAGRAAKGGDGEGGGGEGLKVKRTSIVDLIRPLREAKERDRERERDKEREKEGEERSEEDANISNDDTITEGTNATDLHRAGCLKEERTPAKTLPSTVTPSKAAPSSSTITSSPDLTEGTVAASPGHTPNAMVTPFSSEQQVQMVKSPYGERRLRVTKRALREGKSQSLILLTGLETEDKESASNKKHSSESSSSLERRLQVMLHRIGVAKSLPPEAEMSQNKGDEELRKANSEGAILEKPAPPPTHKKPRTMSTSSDPRFPVRALDPLGPDPALYAKPKVTECPGGVGPTKPAIAAKPSLPTPAAWAARGSHLPSAASPSCSEKRPSPREPPAESTAQDDQNKTHTQSNERKMLPSAPPSWSVISSQERTERVQSVTEDSLPKPHQMKPPPQRRAVSVHEDTLAMTQELKAVLQRSPVRFRGHRGDLPSCIEQLQSNKEEQRSHESEPNEQLDKVKNISGGLKLELQDDGSSLICEGGVAGTAGQIPLSFSPPAAQCVQEEPLRPHQAQEKSSPIPKSKKKSPCTATALPQSPDKSSISPNPSMSSQASPHSPLCHEQSYRTASASVDVRHCTQNTVKVEAADQRTQAPQ
ncbi:capping protein, Arp2/3 and myosin-I linker protein 2 isoform X2 [Gouania willdenowi]|uniref:capping protein, Arp2/3 and myosin-I linker protein 2 isoform X2 n=1 Tax=Gouania willdenowi TaxID=441366 RepID=UPI0010549E9D|nr:nucleolar and coiled-body phosphoprotein 1-like isoform X2 [Gouania willdenowi]